MNQKLIELKETAHRAQIHNFSWDGYNTKMCLEALQTWRLLNEQVEIIVGNTLVSYPVLICLVHMPWLQRCYPAQARQAR
jgi:hypothetical protein